MAGAAEYLAADIAGLGILPHRLLVRSRQSSLAFRAQQQTGQGQIEGRGKANQNAGGRADLASFDLADAGFGDTRFFRQLRQRPVAGITFQPDAALSTKESICLL